MKSETGRAFKKTMKDQFKDIIFKYNSIIAMADYEQDVKDKGKETVEGIFHAIVITSEKFIALCETGICYFEGTNSR